MRNRYGDEYSFEAVDANTYRLVGELKYWRFGGKEGQESIDMNDLGFADPSGGPFISMGYQIEGRKVINISAAGDLDGQPNIVLEVE